jgi:hypothetical protein
MQRQQGRNLLLLAASATLFLFSVALVPAVEFYCRFRGPAVALLFMQMALLTIRARTRAPGDSRALAIASAVFTLIGIGMNAIVVIMARGRC